MASRLNLPGIPVSESHQNSRRRENVGPAIGRSILYCVPVKTAAWISSECPSRGGGGGRVMTEQDLITSPVCSFIAAISATQIETAFLRFNLMVSAIVFAAFSSDNKGCRNHATRLAVGCVVVGLLLFLFMNFEQLHQGDVERVVNHITEGAAHKPNPLGCWFSVAPDICA